ncbi:unnamed protein product [Urochloa humidicola]
MRWWRVARRCSGGATAWPHRGPPRRCPPRPLPRADAIRHLLPVRLDEAPQISLLLTTSPCLPKFLGQSPDNLQRQVGHSSVSELQPAYVAELCCLPREAKGRLRHTGSKKTRRKLRTR